MIDNFGARASDERSRSSGEDPNNKLVDFNDRYHHIPATRDASSIPLVIVGTKCDLVGDREVSREMAIKCVVILLTLLRLQAECLIYMAIC